MFTEHHLAFLHAQSKQEGYLEVQGGPPQRHRSILSLRLGRGGLPHAEATRTIHPTSSNVEDGFVHTLKHAASSGAAVALHWATTRRAT